MIWYEPLKDLFWSIPESIRTFLALPIFPFLPFLDFVDYWLVLHGIWGMLIGFWLGKNKFWTALWIFFIYEVFEFIVIQQGFASPEVILNILSDIGIGCIGYWIVTRNK